MKRVALVLLGLLIAVSTANAKTYTKIVLNNGSVIEGVLIEENNQIVRLEFANRDIRVFYKSDIASLSTFEVITPEEQLIAEYTAAAKAKEAAKAEEQARIAAQKEAEAKAKAEKRAEIAAQKESTAIKQREKGYLQFVDLSYSYCSVTDFLGVNYIGGYRFNHLFFLGLGVGADFALFTPQMEQKYASVKPTRVNIPIYLNFRTNFSDKAWSPYISVSAGARISPAMQELYKYTYNQSGVLGDVSFGVERRLGQKSSLYLGIGYRIESFLGATPMYEWGYIEGFQFATEILHGFNVHVGVSF